MSKILYQVEIPTFKTHIKQSANKWKKINGQSIYTSAHHRVRHVFMEQIHEYLSFYILRSKEPLDVQHQVPMEIHVIIYAPINYGDVRRIRGQVNWKPAKEGYKPKWDLDNFAWIWIKGMQDVLQKRNVITDDTIEFIRKVSYEYVPVDTLDERKMLLTVTQADSKWTKIWHTLFNKE
jgi:hypothetical protein